MSEAKIVVTAEEVMALIGGEVSPSDMLAIREYFLRTGATPVEEMVDYQVQTLLVREDGSGVRIQEWREGKYLFTFCEGRQLVWEDRLRSARAAEARARATLKSGVGPWGEETSPIDDAGYRLRTVAYWASCQENILMFLADEAGDWAEEALRCHQAAAEIYGQMEVAYAADLVGLLRRDYNLP